MTPHLEPLLAAGAGRLWLGLALAALLGLRHATDPDHLTAVATLVAGDERGGPGRAGRLGLWWGAGHGVTCFALGALVVLASTGLAPELRRGAELGVGLLIVGLALRLLVRWRRGHFHVHRHRHGSVEHAHPHFHEPAPGERHGPAHDHAHRDRLARSPLWAFGIGLVHGVGGSALASALLAAAQEDPTHALAFLLAFSLGTVVAMGAASAAFAAALARGPLARRVEQVVPVLGVLSLSFGVWYALDAARLLGAPGAGP